METRTEGGRRATGAIAAEFPLISIITVVYNAAEALSPLLESVFRLKDDDVELIVVDGGSKDRTIDLLRENDARIDYWMSEPDRGIYDAMNKAIDKARGIFLLHLNAGDELISIPRAELKKAASNGVDIAAFRVRIDPKTIFQPSQGFLLRLNNTLHHQGTFFRREGFLPYDIQYKVFADFDVNQKLARRGAKIVLSDEIVALHATGGVSDIPKPSTIAEFFRVIENNYGRLYLPAAWFLCKYRGLQRRFQSIAG